MVDALAERFPGRAIYAITRPACRDLWHGVLPPERVLTASAVTSDRRREPARWAPLVGEALGMAGRHFCLAVDLTGNRYSAALTFLVRPDCSLGFDGNELGCLYSCRVADVERADEHLSRRPFRVIEPLLSPRAFAHHVHRPIRPPAPTRDPADVVGQLRLAGRPYGVLAPGAGWPGKQWPAQRFVEVGRRLSGQGWGCVVTGSQSQQPLCRQVAHRIGRAPVFIGRPLGEVVALLSLAAGVAANDSGIAHLAAALGRRTAAVFTGATEPRKCGPLGRPELVRAFFTPVEPGEVAGFLTANQEFQIGTSE